MGQGRAGKRREEGGERKRLIEGRKQGEGKRGGDEGFWFGICCSIFFIWFFLGNIDVIIKSVSICFSIFWGKCERE